MVVCWGSCNLGLLVSLTSSTRSHSFIHYASAAEPYLSLSNLPDLLCLRAFAFALLSAWETIHPGMRQPCPSHSFRSQLRCYPEGSLTSKFKGAPSSQPLSDSSYFPCRTSSSLMVLCVPALYSWNGTLGLFNAVIPVPGTMSGTARYICCLLNDWNTNHLVKFWGLYNILHRPKPFPAVFQCSYSFVTVSDSATPWTAVRQASLSITNSRSLFKLMSIKSVMPSNHLVLSSPSAFNLSQVFNLSQQFLD